jgi:hypothetical protein
MRTRYSIKKFFLFQSLMALACLFLPFVFMQIGPKGYDYYGPNVPNIWIFGAFVFGKDISWWGINFAFKFQLISILVYSRLAYLCYKYPQKKKRVIVFQAILVCLLVLFPYWVWTYTGGVRSNSDGADLTIYPHIGWIVYLSLIYVQIIILIRIRQQKDGIQTTTV